jgi:dihydropteroate synthase
MTVAANIRVMGIINVTPDSFSDGGSFYSEKAATEQAHQLIDAGADIIDVGGESTRPNAEPVSTVEELSRTIPVIQAIRTFSDVAISIDTSKAEVARQALGAGASIINDVWAFRKDPGLIDVALNSSCEIIIMHMQGSPGTMQDAPFYNDVVTDILDFFRERLATLESAGINLQRIVIDPGIGFGKTLAHNLSVLKHFEKLSVLGQPVMLGHSRKRFLGDVTGLDAPQRDTVTAVVSALCLAKNVSIFRVHDVASTKNALEIARAVNAAT